MKRHALLTLLLIVMPAGEVFAESDAAVPLRDNYSTAELIATSASLAIGPVVLLAGPRLVGSDAASLGAPQRGSLDYEVSARLHGDLETGDRLLFGVSDPLLLALPWATALYYASTASWFAITGEPPGFQTANFHHHAWGYLQALGLTSVTVGLTRLAFRRDRPWVALDRPQFSREGIEPSTSFPSSHTALGFAFASYTARELTSYLVHRRGWGWSGWALPNVVLYGFVGFAAFAHLYDQENFLSDEVIGAAIGAAFGNLVWAAHFDARGRPAARRHSALGRLRLMPLFSSPGASTGRVMTGAALGGSF